jgi:Mce-associated membrane protein
MLSYTPSTVSEFPGTRLGSRGFKSKYHTLMRDKVAPEAKASGVSATAQVVHAAVTSASSDRVEMLMFINVKLTAKGSAAPQETGSRVRVGATKVDGRWLIDRFDTL